MDMKKYMKNLRRRINLIVLIAGGLVFSSCNNWLDVTPSNETEAGKLFSTQRGFQEALSGTYTLMTDAALYGREMTYGFMDIIGQQYEFFNASASTYYYAQNFNYTEGSSIGLCDGIWNKQFNVIANVNDLLAFVDADPLVFSSSLEHDLIKGEALALRAFLHFDLMRLYVPYDAGGSSTEKVMPYVDVLSKNTSASLTFSEISVRILDDLKAASKLLESDPVRTGKPLSNLYFKNRHFHLNYYAVKGLMARVYLYVNQKNEALACAREVIAAQQENDLFPFVSEENATNSDRSRRDRTFSTEHLFTLDIRDLQIYTTGYNYKVNQINGLQLRAGDWGTSPTDKIFEGYDDYRAQFVEKEGVFENISSKFWQMDPKKEFTSKMPLLRITEMYYIAAECGQSASYLNTVRRARNITTDLPEDLEGIDLQAEILKEYDKEFIGEGQVFFYHKRMSDISFNNSVPAQYQLPMPEQEINFGGRPRPKAN